MSRFIKRRSKVAQGLYLLLAGPSKVGKSHWAAQALLAGFKTLWITAGEGDGWRTATKLAGEVDIFDVADLMSESQPINVLRREIESLADSDYDCIVLDSIDGLSRLFEQAVGVAMRRRNKVGAVQLQMQDHGSKKTLITELMQDTFHRLTAKAHVIVTCGLRRETVKEKNQDEYSFFSFDLSGKSAAELPRYFSAVLRIVPDRRQVSIGLTRDDASIAGARIDLPEKMTAADFGQLLIDHDWRQPERRQQAQHLKDWPRPKIKTDKDSGALSRQSRPEPRRPESRQPERQAKELSERLESRQRPQPPQSPQQQVEDWRDYLPPNYKIAKEDIYGDQYEGTPLFCNGDFITDWHIQTHQQALADHRRGQPWSGRDQKFAEIAFDELILFFKNYTSKYAQSITADELGEVEFIRAAHNHLRSASNSRDVMSNVETAPRIGRRYDK